MSDLAAAPIGAAGRSLRWWLIAAVLLVAGLACIAVGLHGHHHRLAGPSAPQFASPPAVSSTPAAPPGSTTAPPADLAVARSTPIALRIPAIGLVVSLSTLGLNPDRTVQVPTDFSQPGWYRLGPTPGQVGSAVILGHVDSYQGPAVFFRLRTLVAGESVDVSLADGVVANFAVTSVVMYEKDQFPARQVYGSHGYSALQLVTCGGTFDTSTGHYLSNVVVYTELSSITHSGAPATGASANAS
jgi:hypothetical protein